MRIACTYRDIYENDNHRWIDEMREAGFSYMEIAVSHLPEDEAVQEEILSYALSCGFSLNLHAPYGKNNISSSDDARRASSLANVKRSIDLAAKYGLGTVTFHPGRCSDDEEDPEKNRARLMGVVADLAAYAKEKQVYVGIENMERRPYELIHTVEELNGFAHLAENNPYFGATMDFAHYFSHGIGMPNLYDLKLPLHDVHLSQSVEGMLHRSLVSEGGALDLSDVCRRLTDYGYDGFLVLEIGEHFRESKELLEQVLATLK